MYDWITLLYTWNSRNIAAQPYAKKEKKKDKRKMWTPDPKIHTEVSVFRALTVWVFLRKWLHPLNIWFITIKLARKLGLAHISRLKTDREVVSHPFETAFLVGNSAFLVIISSFMDSHPVLTSLGPWPVSSGPWPVSSGPSPVPSGPWPVSSGPWPLSSGPWPVSSGPWPMSSGPWTVPSGLSDDIPPPLKMQWCSAHKEKDNTPTDSWPSLLHLECRDPFPSFVFPLSLCCLVQWDTKLHWRPWGLSHEN